MIDAGPPRRGAVRLVPTGQAAVDEATKRALARVGMATEGEEPVEAVVSLVSHPAATALARQWQAPLLTLAIGGAAGPRRLELPTVAAAGRSVELLLVAVSPRGGPLRQLVAGAVKSSGLAPQMTVQRILTTCADWPARALADGSPLVSRELPDAALGAAGAPAWLGLPLHAARNAVERVRDMLTEETWAVGIAPRPVASFLERPGLDDVVWLQIRKRHPRGREEDAIFVSSGEPETDIDRLPLVETELIHRAGGLDDALSELDAHERAP